MAGDRNRSGFWAVGVLVVPVVATRPVHPPAVLFDRLDYVSDLHFAYPLHTDVLARRSVAVVARAPIGDWENLSVRNGQTGS